MQSKLYSWPASIKTAGQHSVRTMIPKKLKFKQFVGVLPNFKIRSWLKPAVSRKKVIITRHFSLCQKSIFCHTTSGKWWVQIGSWSRKMRGRWLLTPLVHERRMIRLAPTNVLRIFGQPGFQPNGLRETDLRPDGQSIQSTDKIDNQ